MKSKLFFLIPLLLFTIFTQAQLEKDRLEIYSYVDKIIDHSTNFGKDTAFYSIVNSFGKKLEKYRKKHGIDSVFLNNSILYAKEIRIKKPTESFRILEENIVHSSEIGDLKSLNMYYHELGRLYHDFGYVEKAAELFSKTAENFNKNKDYPAYGYSLIDIGNLYFESDQYRLAEDYYEKAYKIFVEHLKGKDLRYALAVYSNNMGLLKLETNDFKIAKEWFYKALEYRKKDNMRSYYSHTYLYLVRLFAKSGNNDSVIFYYGKAAEIQEKEGLFDDLTNTYLESSDFYLNLEKLDLSRTLLEKANNIITKNDLNGFSTQYHYQYVILYHKLQKIDSALYHVIIVDSLSRKYKQKEFEELAVKAMIAIYSHKGDYKKVVELYKRYMDIRDENNNYEILKREVKIQVDEKKKVETLNEEIEKRNKALNIVYILLIAFSISIVIISIRARKKIAYKNKELNESLKHQSLTYSIIAHDLRGPIGSVIGGLEMVVNQDVDDAETSKMIINSAYKTLETSYHLLENLLVWSKFKNRKINQNPERLKLKQIIDDSCAILKTNCDTKSLSLTNLVDEKHEIKGDQIMISTIFRNLISNSIKFSNPGGQITISSQLGMDTIKIIVRDEGVGMSAEVIDKILTSTDLNETTHGTGNEKGTGLGLLIVKEFISNHGGKLTIESKVGKGSKFIIELPN